ncbi:ATP-binding protein [Kitasatospora sp. NPDC101157]|uniref:ATP-binding protein n=1 Tax=Kitasatospora sp. NPDC101157 TaxID=3364098 RepID=UPI00382BE7E5
MNTSRELLGNEPVPHLTAVPAGGQRRRLALAGVPRPVARARTFTATALADWAWPDPARAGDIVLLAAELVSNAMLHADGAVELALHITTARLRIAVSDRSPALPELRRPHRPGLPGGHGLFIVQQTCDRWGAAPHRDGKTVWAECDL